MAECSSPKKVNFPVMVGLYKPQKVKDYLLSYEGSDPGRRREPGPLQGLPRSLSGPVWRCCRSWRRRLRCRRSPRNLSNRPQLAPTMLSPRPLPMNAPCTNSRKMQLAIVIGLSMSAVILATLIPTKSCPPPHQSTHRPASSAKRLGECCGRLLGP